MKHQNFLRATIISIAFWLINPPPCLSDYLALRSVEFQGTNFHPIKKDDSSGFYDAPHFTYDPPNGDGRQYPVSFTQGTKMRAVAIFDVVPADPPNPTPYYDVWGWTIWQPPNDVPPGPYDFPTQRLAPVGNVVTYSAEAINSFSNIVDCSEPMLIDWHFTGIDADGFPAGNAGPAGGSYNYTYITLKDPATPNFFRTVVAYACRNAGLYTPGPTDDGSAFTNSWAFFAGPGNVTTWDNQPLYYYRPGEGFSGIPLTVPGLLAAKNGNCDAWRNFFGDVLRANGITTSVNVLVLPNHPPGFGADDGFLVKNWSKGTGSAFPPYSWRIRACTSVCFEMVGCGPVYGDLTSIEGLPGQNSATPSEKVFGNHRILRFGPTWYDPSYGVTYASPGNMESTVIHGFDMQCWADPCTGEATTDVRDATGSGGLIFIDEF